RHERWRENRSRFLRRIARTDRRRPLAAGGGGSAAVCCADRRVYRPGAKAPASRRNFRDDQAMIGIFDKFSLIGMALGVAMMLQPWWPDRFRAGFFLTIVTTIVQIII